MAEEEFYVIGIDFGTTYSGVAWCWSGQPENINLVTRWKTKLNMTSDNAKTPTEIYYNRTFGAASWGYDIPPDVEPIRWFKLLLVDEEELSPELRNSTQIKRAKELVKQYGKDRIQVIADYLRLLWTHVVDDITRDRGSSAYKGSPLKVCITIPAIWGEVARKRMRTAAEHAGILEPRSAGQTILQLVSEPEAAALACLDDLQRRPDVKVGDTYVVCDAGGGTVDLISYAIDSVRPIRVRECVEGKGKMCGAIFIDEAFESKLKSVLGDKWGKISAGSRKTMLNSEWEYGIKRLFDDSSREWSVQVPSEALSHSRLSLKRSDEKKGEVPMRGGQLKFSQGHVRDFFETVMPQIRGLIQEQVDAVQRKYNRAPTAILLVGGLGACNYLYQVVKTEFEAQDIMVLQSSGARPWTAICRGAVMRGLSDPGIEAIPSMVISRVSRVSYGTDTYVKFVEGVHHPADKTWHPGELRFIADKQMRWYLKRGDDIYTEEPVSMTFYNLCSKPPETLSMKLFYTEAQDAPYRKTGVVKPLVTIRIHVKKPFEQFPEWRNANGKIFRKIEYDIRMSSDGVTMKWEVLISGELQGSSNVEILSGIDDPESRPHELPSNPISPVNTNSTNPVAPVELPIRSTEAQRLPSKTPTSLGQYALEIGLT